jgi:uncharacterized membrane protein YkvA (DUF1232 family)
MAPKKFLNYPLLMRLFQDLRLLAALLRDYWRGDYRNVSMISIVVFLLSVAYILSPLDLIPDYLLGLGQIDDLAVLGLGLFLLESDLSKYNRWRSEKKN